MKKIINDTNKLCILLCFLVSFFSTFVFIVCFDKQLSCAVGCLRPWRHRHVMQVRLWPNFSKVSPWGTCYWNNQTLTLRRGSATFVWGLRLRTSRKLSKNWEKLLPRVQQVNWNTPLLMSEGCRGLLLREGLIFGFGLYLLRCTGHYHLLP